MSENKRIISVTVFGLGCALFGWATGFICGWLVNETTS